MPDGMTILCSSTHRIIDESSKCEYCNPDWLCPMTAPSECECDTRELIYRLFYHTIVWTNDSAETIEDTQFYIRAWDFSEYDKSTADNLYDEIVANEGDMTLSLPNCFTLYSTSDNKAYSNFTKYISLEFERLCWDYQASISYRTYINKLKDYIRDSIVKGNGVDYKLNGASHDRIRYGTTRFKKR